MDPRDVVTQFFVRMEARDWRGAEQLLHDAIHIEYTATGETFDGPSYLAMNEAYPEGWRLDVDFTKDAFRGVQFTPPGSSCSIHFGKGLTTAAPGSARGLFLVVSDIEAARAALVTRGVEVGDLFHRGIGEPPASGIDPMRRSYASYATFEDPDGNEWLLQEVTARGPGRVDASETALHDGLRALMEARVPVLAFEIEGARLSDAFLAMTEEPAAEHEGLAR